MALARCVAAAAAAAARGSPAPLRLAPWARAAAPHHHQHQQQSLYSSGAAVVDQMLAYVQRDLQGRGQAAVDVLRSGLSLQPDAAAGYDSGRLQLALSEVFVAEHDWAQAAAAGSTAAAAFAADMKQLPAAAALSGVAAFQAGRCLLAAGRDADAADAAAAAAADASAASQQPPPPAPLQLGRMAQRLLVAHATAGDARAQAAALEQLDEVQGALAAAQQQQTPPGGGGGGGSAGTKSDTAVGLLLALGHKAAGDAALGQGSLDAAHSSYRAAKKAIEQTISSSSSSGVSDGAGAAVLSSRLQQEVAADVAMGAAQVLMAGKEWEAAEEELGAALKAAEAAAGGDSAGALLVPVLLLLAQGYCRTARVMVAEGLLRECGKLLGATEPARLLAEPAGAGGGGHQAVHPSLKAAVAWRYFQLLTALPNRGAEAAAWADAARGAWARAGAGLQDRAIADVLGDEAALKGQGQHGSGGVVSLVARRLLPPLV